MSDAAVPLRVLLIASPACGLPDIADADALVLAEAPAAAPDWLLPLRRRSGAPPLYVRVAPGAGDLAAALALRPDGIVLPRIADGSDIARLGVHLAVHEAEAGLPDGATKIVAGLDGARALLRFGGRRATCPRLAGLFCAFDELARALGVVASSAVPWPAPLAQARGLLVLAAAAAGVPAFVLPSPSNGRDAALAARRDGFQGGFAESAEAAAFLAGVFRQAPRAAESEPGLPDDRCAGAGTTGHPDCALPHLHPVALGGGCA